MSHPSRALVAVFLLASAAAFAQGTTAPPESSAAKEAGAQTPETQAAKDLVTKYLTAVKAKKWADAKKLLHPDTLKYLVQAAGFVRIDLRFLSPVSDSDRLQEVRFNPQATDLPQVILDLVEASNANAVRLNRQLFSHRDYAIVATK